MKFIDELDEFDKITEGLKSRELFTDRRSLIRLFLNYLQEGTSKILFFHGDGGHGKTLLLWFLQTYCCKQFSSEEWEKMKAMSDEELMLKIKRPKEEDIVPMAELNFGMKPVGVNNPQDSLSALLMLRRQFKEYKSMKFPFFDYLYISYLKRTSQQLTEELLHDLYPVEEVNFASAVMDIFHGGIPIAGTAALFLEVFNKHFKKDFNIFMAKRKLKAEDLEALEQIESRDKMIEMLPVVFAEDLNANLGKKYERIVLFFDTHESFWGATVDPSDEEERDEWLRKLVRHLDILVVVAGRTPPRWAKAKKVVVPEEKVDLQLVDYFSEIDALDYLTRAGITDSSVQGKIIEYASYKKDKIHPFWLGLCAEVALAAERSGKNVTDIDFPEESAFMDKGNELVKMFFHYLDDIDMKYSIKALSACRSFDEGIYNMLGDEKLFIPSLPRYKLLTQFSFIWESETNGEKWYRVHDLLRNLFNGQRDEVTMRAHKVLEKYYETLSEKEDLSYGAESIYHINQLEWKEGVNRWFEGLFLGLLSGLSRYCSALIDIRSELIIPEELSVADISATEGLYYVTINKLESAIEKIQASLSIYDKLLMSTKSNVGALYFSKAFSLQNLGSILETQGHHKEATDAIQEANDLIDKAAKYQKASFIPEYILDSFSGEFNGKSLKEIARGNKNLSEYFYQSFKIKNFMNLGKIRAASSKLSSDVLGFYEKAILDSDELLKNFQFKELNQDNENLLKANIYMLKACAYRDKAKIIQSKLGDNKYAEKTYLEGLENIEKACTLSQVTFVATNYLIKSDILAYLAELQPLLFENKKEAREIEIAYFKKAVTICDEILKHAPNLIIAYRNKAYILMSLAKLYKEDSNPKEARKVYKKAFLEYTELISREPDNIFFHKQKGLALNNYEANGESTKTATKLDNYHAALEEYDMVLKELPEDQATRNWKLVVLRNIADVFERSLNYEKAVAYYFLALEEVNMLLKISSNNVEYIYEKVSVLRMLASLYKRLGQQQISGTYSLYKTEFTGDILDKQFTTILSLRKKILESSKNAENSNRKEILKKIHKSVATIVEKEEKSSPNQLSEDESIISDFIQIIPFDNESQQKMLLDLQQLSTKEDKTNFLIKIADDMYAFLEKEVSDKSLVNGEKIVMHSIIDAYWIGYLGKITTFFQDTNISNEDKLNLYNSELAQKFKEMLDLIDERIVHSIYKRKKKDL